MWMSWLGRRTRTSQRDEAWWFHTAGTLKQPFPVHFQPDSELRQRLIPPKDKTPSQSSVPHGGGGGWGGPWFSCCPANPAEMLSWTFLVSRSLTYPQRQQPRCSLVPRVAGVCVLNWCYAKARHMLKNTTVRLFRGAVGSRPVPSSPVSLDSGKEG